MENNQLDNLDDSNNELRKDNRHLTQIKIVFNSFCLRPKTMLMVSSETGIRISNICRHVSCLRKNNRIVFVKTDICPISKRSNVQFFCSNNVMNTNIIELLNDLRL